MSAGSLVFANLRSLTTVSSTGSGKLMVTMLSCSVGYVVKYPVYVCYCHGVAYLGALRYLEIDG